jgi:hypothetical protein
MAKHVHECINSEEPDFPALEITYTWLANAKEPSCFNLGDACDETSQFAHELSANLEILCLRW